MSYKFTTDELNTVMKYIKLLGISFFGNEEIRLKNKFMFELEKGEFGKSTLLDLIKLINDTMPPEEIRKEMLYPINDDMENALKIIENRILESSDMNLYEVLGVSSIFSSEAIKAAHMSLIKNYQSSKKSISENEDDEEKTKEINYAAFILLDPIKRQKYDERIKSKNSVLHYEPKKEQRPEEASENINTGSKTERNNDQKQTNYLKIILAILFVVIIPMSYVVYSSLDSKDVLSNKYEKEVVKTESIEEEIPMTMINQDDVANASKQEEIEEPKYKLDEEIQYIGQHETMIKESYKEPVEENLIKNSKFKTLIFESAWYFINEEGICYAYTLVDSLGFGLEKDIDLSALQDILGEEIGIVDVFHVFILDNDEIVLALVSEEKVYGLYVFKDTKGTEDYYKMRDILKREYWAEFLGSSFAYVIEVLGEPHNQDKANQKMLEYYDISFGTGLEVYGPTANNDSKIVRTVVFNKEVHGITHGMTKDEVKNILGEYDKRVSAFYFYEFEGYWLCLHYESDTNKLILITFCDDKTVNDFERSYN